MNIIVFDNSRGKSYKKTCRHFSKVLIKISDRKFVGNLPRRIIEEMIFNVSKMVSKKSNLLILVANKDGFHGWAGYHFGKNEEKEKYIEFLIAEDYTSKNK